MRKALPRGSNTRPSIDASRAAHDRIPVCVFLMAALVLAPIGATAAAEVKLRCDIVAYGLITLGETPASHQRRLASFLSSGKHTMTTRASVIKETSKIPLILHTVFGAQVVILGRYPSRETDYEVRWSIPSRTNPNTGKFISKDVASMRGRLGHRHLNAFVFTEEWELIPGRYTMQIWHEQGELCSQAFEVVDSGSISFAEIPNENREQ